MASLISRRKTTGFSSLGPIGKRGAPIYDKAQDGHYNLISALHKSVRGSDPDAALYYLCRMLDAGEPPLYIARRAVRMAVEDIGMADPQALVQTNAAKDAYDFLGSPEGELALAQATVYLATAPKSNAAYVAFGAASRAAKEGGSLSPPKHILNAPTKLMQQEGYGSGYAYDHSEDEAFSGQNYFPDGMERPQFYAPTRYGYEAEIKERLERWAKLRNDVIDQFRIDRPQHIDQDTVMHTWYYREVLHPYLGYVGDHDRAPTVINDLGFTDTGPPIDSVAMRLRGARASAASRVAAGDTLLRLRDPATPLGRVHVVAASSARSLVAFLESPFALTRACLNFGLIVKGAAQWPEAPATRASSLTSSSPTSSWTPTAIL